MKKVVESRYRTVKLPVVLIEEVDRLIDVFEEHGYTSRADFIKQAIREKIIELETLEAKRRGKKKTRVYK